jgi:hypothetical protein
MDHFSNGRYREGLKNVIGPLQYLWVTFRKCGECLCPSSSTSRFNPLKPTLVFIIVKNSARTSKRTEQGSSVSIVSDYGLDTGWLGFDARQGQRIFPLASVSRPVVGPTQPPIQWVPGILSPGQSAAGAWRWPLTHLVQRPRMNRSYISSPPKRYHGV